MFVVEPELLGRRPRDARRRSSLRSYAGYSRRPSPGDAILLGLGLVLPRTVASFEAGFSSVCARLTWGSPSRTAIPNPPPTPSYRTSPRGGRDGGRQPRRHRFGVPDALLADEASYNHTPVCTGGDETFVPARLQARGRGPFFTEWCVGQWARHATWAGWWAYHRERLDWLLLVFRRAAAVPTSDVALGPALA